VIFDPGGMDPDPSVYFSAVPGDPSGDILMEFRLLHEQ
jgi:hypothetical protein